MMKRLPSPDSRITAVSALAVSAGIVTSPANAPHSICLRINSMTRLCVTVTRRAIGSTPDSTLSGLRVPSGNPGSFRSCFAADMFRLGAQEQGLRKAG